MAQVSQIQLVQPVLSICWAGLILGEDLTWATIIGGTAVILCAGLAVRSRPGAARAAAGNKAEAKESEGHSEGHLESEPARLT
jgi:drug/metabolite transporter (DMT)-like permease